MIDYAKESSKTLNRILETIHLTGIKKTDKELFIERLNEHFCDLFKSYYQVYGDQYDFYYHIHHLVQRLAENYANRSNTLKKKDQNKAADPSWYLSNDMLGMACYVDLYGGDFKSLENRIPYLKNLGVTYLHLMPLYKSPEGESDGGYAVSDYRQTNPKLGTVDDLKHLALALNKAGINLVLDFVFNHTADDHRWAQLAKQGDEEYQNYYYMFDDKTIPDQYEQHLREIFPQVRRGNFTFDPVCNKWVWTTFNNFQWDLNYSNPALFNSITDEMLFLANLGCDALRLDALAFIWKELGTNCENQDKAHVLIKAFNACLRIVAPSVVFKSEAIVHPDEVIKYIDVKECQLSYNPLLMALIWNSLATRKTKLITKSMQKTGYISHDCSWVNYVRGHDDIGWTFDDAVASELGINGDDHRRFLNQFYTGKFEGSFANGVPFGENPSNGDCRVCGSLASLCGLEKALQLQSNEQSNEQTDKGETLLVELAIKRVLLVHGVILSIGGIPLLYAGDELGMLNDYSYRDVDSKRDDDRWVHRTNVTDEQLENPAQPIITQELKNLIGLRKNYDIFGQAATHYLDAPNQHTFAFIRESGASKCLCIFNFSEHEVYLHSDTFNVLGASLCVDLTTMNTIDCKKDYSMSSYQMMWLYVA